MNPTVVVEYAYLSACGHSQAGDAEGNRVRKTIDGTVVINYLVDTNRDYAQVLEERDGSGNVLARYVYGHDLISQTRPSAGSGTETSYYHYDGLGSTRALSNGSQVVTDTYVYDAFGNLLDKTGTTTNEYLYTGEFFDSNLGFYYLRARYMNPENGRFVTMDEFAGRNRDPYSLHKYLYANANPVNRIDPSGNFAIGGTTEIQGVQKEYGQLQGTGARITQKVVVPMWKRILTKAFLAGYIMAPASILVGDLIQDALQSNDNKPVSPETLVSILVTMQTLLQIRYGIDSEGEHNPEGRTFYRGLDKTDVKELKDFSMIRAKVLRQKEFRSHWKLIRSGDSEWIRIFLQEELKNFALNSKVHTVGRAAEVSWYISITTDFAVARKYAHSDPSPSGKVLIVNTARAIDNTDKNSRQSEWLVPFVIVRYVETVGDPFDVPAP